MQSEVYHGARFSAASKGLFPLLFVVAYMISRHGSFEPSKMWVVFAAVGLALWLMRGAIKPKLLLLDHAGLVYQPPFSSISKSISWRQVLRFDIKGSGNARKLVCYYLNPQTGTTESLKLGDGWSSDGTPYFADRLEKVLLLLEDARRRYQQGMPPSAAPVQRQGVDMVRQPVPPRAPQQRPQNPVQQPAPAVRSGQVYAQTSANTKSPAVDLSDTPKTGGSNLTGWGLLLVGLGIGAASAYAFMGACKSGMCGQSLWEMPDPRLWIFLLVWSACLWAIWAGMRRLSG